VRIFGRSEQLSSWCKKAKGIVPHISLSLKTVPRIRKDRAILCSYSSAITSSHQEPASGLWPLLIPIIFLVPFLWWKSFTVPDTKVALFSYICGECSFTACVAFSVSFLSNHTLQLFLMHWFAAAQIRKSIKDSSPKVCQQPQQFLSWGDRHSLCYFKKMHTCAQCIWHFGTRNTMFIRLTIQSAYTQSWPTLKVKDTLKALMQLWHPKGIWHPLPSLRWWLRCAGLALHTQGVATACAPRLLYSPQMTQHPHLEDSHHAAADCRTSTPASFKSRCLQHRPWQRVAWQPPAPL